jgi:hypothetical protein
MVIFSPGPGIVLMALASKTALGHRLGHRREIDRQDMRPNG